MRSSCHSSKGKRPVDVGSSNLQILPHWVSGDGIEKCPAWCAHSWPGILGRVDLCVWKVVPWPSSNQVLGKVGKRDVGFLGPEWRHLFPFLSFMRLYLLQGFFLKPGGFDSL